MPCHKKRDKTARRTRLALQNKLNQGKQKEEVKKDKPRPEFHVQFEIRVGAILRFLGSLVSSFSASSASLFTPVLGPGTTLGVSGGVVKGTPVTLPELAAVIDGTLPLMRGGLLTTPDCVATEDVEFDLVGEDGRLDGTDDVAGGEGAVKELAELRD